MFEKLDKTKAANSIGPTSPPWESEIIKKFDEVIKDKALNIANIVIEKQRHYGKDNIKDFGEMGILIRANDKFARLKNMILNKMENSEEPKKDTWTDIIGYALLALMLEDGTFDLPLEKASYKYDKEKS